MNEDLTLWLPAFLRWIKGIYGEQWRDNAVPPDIARRLKKGFRAGWRAAVQEAQRRAVSRMLSGDARAREAVLLIRCPHCGKSPADTDEPTTEAD